MRQNEGKLDKQLGSYCRPSTPVEEWKLQVHKHLSFKVVKQRQEITCQLRRLDFGIKCKVELETWSFFDSRNSSSSSSSNSNSRDNHVLEGVLYANFFILTFMLIILSIRSSYAHFKSKNIKDSWQVRTQGQMWRDTKAHAHPTALLSQETQTVRTFHLSNSFRKDQTLAKKQTVSLQLTQLPEF